MKQRYLEAGQIVNTHGLAGEVKILPWADDVGFLLDAPRFYIGGREYIPAAKRAHKECVIVRFEGIDDINAAMALKNKVVAIDREDVSIPEGRVFVADLIGCRVLDESGAEIGKISDVMSLPANDVYVVSGERERLIPAVEEFVISKDLDAGTVTVRLIEGM